MSEIAEEIIEDGKTAAKMMLKAVTGILVIPTAVAYSVYQWIGEDDA